MSVALDTREPGPTSLTERGITLATRPLDLARAVLWRLSAKTSFGRACIRDRGLRLTTLALAHMAAALTLTLAFPVWLLLLGPLLLGVPHVAGDVRYLLLKPPLPLGRLGLVLILGPLLLMTLLRVVAAAGGPYSAPLEVGLGAAAMAGGVLAARTSIFKTSLGLAAVLALGLYCATRAELSMVVIAHLHNLVAVGLWLYFLRGEVKARGLALILIAYVGIAALFLGGVFDTLLMDHAVAGGVGRFSLDEMVWSLAPGLDYEPGLRWVALYAFAQSIHYAIWIRLIPQRLDPRTAPPTFRRSLSRVHEDFGRVGFALIALATIAVPLAAVFTDAASTRHAYLLAAIAHGYIELALIAALLARGRAAREGTP